MPRLDRQQMNERLDELADSFHRVFGSGSVEMKRPAEYFSGVTGFGLTAHVHHLARAVQFLYSEGLYPAAVPLVRQMIECGMTAAWVQVYGDRAARAVGREFARNRSLTLDEFVRAGVEDDPLARKAVDGYLEAFSPDAKTEGQKFYERCEELAGATGIYSMYRAASTVSHASFAVPDMYVRPDEVSEEYPFGISLRTRPSGGVPDSWLSLALTMVVVAGLALDRFEVGHSRRTRLKEVARELDVRAEMRMSNLGYSRNENYKRKEKAAQRARRSNA